MNGGLKEVCLLLLPVEACFLGGLGEDVCHRCVREACGSQCTHGCVVAEKVADRVADARTSFLDGDVEKCRPDSVGGMASGGNVWGRPASFRTHRACVAADVTEAAAKEDESTVASDWRRVSWDMRLWPVRVSFAARAGRKLGAASGCHACLQHTGRIGER